MRKLMTTVLALGLTAIAAYPARATPPPTFTEVCSDNTPVSTDGTFNIDVSCPAGIEAGTTQSVLTGGYSCSYNGGENVLPVIVSVNTFFGGYVGGPFPTGWQTIGQTLESANVTGHTYACENNSSGTVRIVPSCTVGTNGSPCRNGETCTDLSGQSSQPVYSNPTCQVCITCCDPFFTGCGSPPA